MKRADLKCEICGKMVSQRGPGVVRRYCRTRRCEREFHRRYVQKYRKPQDYEAAERELCQWCQKAARLPGEEYCCQEHGKQAKAYQRFLKKNEGTRCDELPPGCCVEERRVNLPCHKRRRTWDEMPDLMEA